MNSTIKVPVDLACAIADFRVVLVKHANNLVNRINFKGNFIASNYKQLGVKLVEGILGTVVTSKAIVGEQLSVKLAGSRQGDGFRGTGVSDFHTNMIAFLQCRNKGVNRTGGYGKPNRCERLLAGLQRLNKPRWPLALDCSPRLSLGLSRVARLALRPVSSGFSDQRLQCGGIHLDQSRVKISEADHSLTRVEPPWTQAYVVGIHNVEQDPILAQPVVGTTNFRVD